jgi:hypothetical protein
MGDRQRSMTCVVVPRSKTEGAPEQNAARKSGRGCEIEFLLGWGANSGARTLSRAGASQAQGIGGYTAGINGPRELSEL